MSRRQFRADDPVRRTWQDPEEIFGMIGLGPGMVFVDMGCGDGYFALPAARKVGNRGRVYAADIDADAIARLCQQAEREGLKNIVARSGEAEMAVPCEGCADLVFFGIALHDFCDPGQVIRNARIMLKPSGHLADLDWMDQPMEFGPPLQKRFSIEKARRMIESGGFGILSVRDAGPYHYLILGGRS